MGKVGETAVVLPLLFGGVIEERCRRELIVVSLLSLGALGNGVNIKGDNVVVRKMAFWNEKAVSVVL